MGYKYVGEHLCLITGNKDASKSNNSIIVIAHGAQRVGKSFPLEGGEVWFYCPEGSTLLANKYEFFRKQVRTKMVDKLSSPKDKTCPDYYLHKTTTYHGGDSHALLGKEEIIRICRDNPAEAERKGYSDYDHLDKLVSKKEVKHDIASVRHRWFSNGTTFSNVMKMLKKEGYGYGEVHCYFCRSAPNDPKVWNLQLGQYV